MCAFCCCASCGVAVFQFHMVFVRCVWALLYGRGANILVLLDYCVVVDFIGAVSVDCIVYGLLIRSEEGRVG